MSARSRRWTPERLLAEAASWGDLLCREAYWYEERCSWVGHSPDESFDGPLLNGVTSLGPDLYAGTAGVALFLATLNTLRPKSVYRETARGAIRHAHGRAGDLDPDVAIGLHTGAIGVALAMGIVGHRCQDERLVAAAMDLARDVAARPAKRPLLDFVSGTSGAICGLLAMSRWTDGATLVAHADALGRDLLARGTAGDGVWCWANADLSGGAQWPRPLNGLAHGQAGPGTALLELHDATGGPEYLEAGLGAFAYEDQFLDEREGNWADLRDETQGAGPAGGAGAHTIAWCHGAPGIALTRLRALRLVPAHASRLQRTAAAALRGAVGFAESRLGTEAFDVTSCHGLAGLTEPLVMAADALEDPTHLERARELWGRACARREAKATWMSGVASGGRNHSLMLGIAGLGYGLLRACEPARVPSILLPA